MGAFTHCSGPVEIFVRFRSGVTAYLGTCTEAPEVEVEKRYGDIHNDLSGGTQGQPFQAVLLGETHTITAVANRLDFSVYSAIRDETNSGQLLGGELAIERGTLAVANSDFELILRYTYAGNPATLALSQTDFPLARRYFSAKLAAYKESTGSRVFESAMVFRTWNIFDPQTRTFKLFTENPNQIGSLPDPS